MLKPNYSFGHSPFYDLFLHISPGIKLPKKQDNWNIIFNKRPKLYLVMNVEVKIQILIDF